MTNPTLRQFVQASTFNESTGFPQGDTFFDLDTATVEKFKFKASDGTETDKTKISQGGKSFAGPIVVYREIQKIVNSNPNAKRVRVTRTGTGRMDTRYTVVAVDGGN